MADARVANATIAALRFNVFLLAKNGVASILISLGLERLDKLLEIFFGVVGPIGKSDVS